MNKSDSDPTLATKTIKPFIKWAGGKSQLLGQFARYYPEELRSGAITRYVEPFLGGGAVFLDLLQRYDISEARLFDINPELILVYKVVKREPDALITLLTNYSEAYFAHAESDRAAFYYDIRDAYNAQLPEIDFDVFTDAWITRAAYMIFLNKTCFNGLYRVNSRGHFNVPFGKYKRPTIVDGDNLLQVSSLLQRAELFVGRFQASEPHINDRSFVYFDPPYRPLSTTANFTSYSKNKFDDDDQTALANFFAKLASTTNAKLMLSNSDPKNTNPDDLFFDELYQPFHRHTVFANRMINSKANGRGKISELLVTNYDQHCSDVAAGAS